MGFDNSADLLFRIMADPKPGLDALDQFATELKSKLAAARLQAGAAGDPLDQLTADFRARSAAIKGDIDDMRQHAAAGADAAASSLSKPLMAALGGVAVAAAAAAKGILDAAQYAARYAEEIDDARDTTGLTVEQLSRLRYVAEQNGVSFDTLHASLANFAKAIDGAVQGSDKYEKAFERLGIKRAELERGQKDMLPVLYRVMDAYHANESAVEKTANAKVLFTRSGQQMIEMLSRGSVGVRELERDADALGVTLTDKDVEAAKKFTVELRAMEAQFRAIKLEIGQGVTPLLTSFIVGLEATMGGIKKAGFPRPTPTWFDQFFQGFDESGMAAVRRLQQMTAGAAAAGGGFGGRTEDTPTARAKRDYSQISDLVERLRTQTAGLAGDGARVAAEVGAIWDEVAKRTQAFERAVAEGTLTPEAIKREAAALGQLPLAAAQAGAALEKQLAQRRQKAVLDAGVELENQISRQATDSLEKRHEDWDAELAALRNKYVEEQALTDANQKRLEELRQAGHQRIEREWAQDEAQKQERADRDEQRERDRQKARDERAARDQAEYERKLMEVARPNMTARERLAAQWERDKEEFRQLVQFEKDEFDLGETSDYEYEAIQARYERMREAMYEGQERSLNRLANSQGWRGVFGNFFAQGIRENEELLRDWAEAGNQSALMMEVTLESLSETGQRAFGMFAGAMGQNIAQAIVYSESIGKAMQEAVASTLASIAAESYVQAIYATALGFLRLAQWDWQGASQAFTAAAVFGSVGTAAAVAGRAVAPKKGGSQGAGGSAGGGGGSTGASAVESGGARGAAVAVYVYGHVVGVSGVEELTELINEAVEGRDVKLVASDVKRPGQVVR